jgi:hypothetical protein
MAVMLNMADLDMAFTFHYIPFFYFTLYIRIVAAAAAI